MIVDKLEEIAKVQASAISNIDFEKVVVYDGGNGDTVGNFLGGLTKALPPFHEVAKMAGIELAGVPRRDVPGRRTGEGTPRHREEPDRDRSDGHNRHAAGSSVGATESFPKGAAVAVPDTAAAWARPGATPPDGLTVWPCPHSPKVSATCDGTSCRF